MILFPSSFPIPKVLRASSHSFSVTDRCPTTSGTTSTSHPRSAARARRPVCACVCVYVYRGGAFACVADGRDETEERGCCKLASRIPHSRDRYSLLKYSLVLKYLTLGTKIFHEPQGTASSFRMSMWTRKHMDEVWFATASFGPCLPAPPGRLKWRGHRSGGEALAVEYSSSSISIVHLCESL
jgi:hypothetical protein